MVPNRQGGRDNNKSLLTEQQLNNNPEKPFKTEIIWENVLLMLVLHIGAIYGLVFGLLYAKWQTVLWTYLLHAGSAVGVIAGAHRLWSHRAYKANLPLRIMLMLLQTMALQRDIYEWCRDHRVHHRYSETDADPHNSKRGYFFAHIGWLLSRKHPQVIEKGSKIDLTDLMADPVVRYQRLFYVPLVAICWAAIPTFVPCRYWNEDVILSFFFCVMYRFVHVLHCSFMVNSSAHMYGMGPYDKSISPREGPNVRYLTYGEGYHNYHHAFPWDYSASELGWERNFNPSTLVIDCFAWLGWAWDRRKATENMVESRKQRIGDRIGFTQVNVVLDWLYGIGFVTYPIWGTYLIRLPFSLCFQMPFFV